MRILMLGNSFTSANNMPAMLSKYTDASVVFHTRAAARLSDHLNWHTQFGIETQIALSEERWDYVVLQELSIRPITSRKLFLEDVKKLCDLIKNNGAKPVLFVTWAYKNNSYDMTKLRMSSEEMTKKIYDVYHEAADQNNALVADVGQRFFRISVSKNLYAEDGRYPNKEGSRIAAETIAAVVLADQRNRKTSNSKDSNKTVSKLSINSDSIEARLNDISHKTASSNGEKQNNHNNKDNSKSNKVKTKPKGEGSSVIRRVKVIYSGDRCPSCGQPNSIDKPIKVYDYNDNILTVLARVCPCGDIYLTKRLKKMLPVGVDYEMVRGYLFTSTYKKSNRLHRFQDGKPNNLHKCSKCGKTKLLFGDKGMCWECYKEYMNAMYD